MTDKTIRTAEDVFNHFGADYDPEKPLEENNRWLSRRTYKDTSCGAWAKVDSRPGIENCRGFFSAHYAKVDGIWELVCILRHRPLHPEPENMGLNVHADVRRYFWPDGVDVGMQEFLNEKAGGHFFWDSPKEDIEWKQPTGESRLEFICGSIVEGTDAEVTAQPVTLPCSPADLDATIKWVEDEVQSIWNQTHGCEGCEKLAEKEYGKGCWEGQVMADCPECGGDGACI